MKKLYFVLGCVALLIGPGTIAFMGYRYIWFAIETIPVDRIGFAFIGGLLFTVTAIGFFIAADN